MEDMFEGLHKGLGVPKMAVHPPESFFTTAGMTTDEDLVSLWRQDGWARYGQGLFWTVDPREFADLHQEWPIVPRGALVFGRGAFSSLFLLHQDQVLHLDGQWNRLAKLGPSSYVFLNDSVADAEFQKTILDRELFNKVREKAGDLAADECYGLFPALPLGGNDEDPNGYQRVKLREYLAILGQAHG